MLRPDRASVVKIAGIGTIVALWLAAGILAAELLARVTYGGRPYGEKFVAVDGLSWGRPFPFVLDHDEHGFRNPLGLEKACVVITGDSQIYGSGVSRDHALPRQLQDRLGAPVYGVAVPGWGTQHQRAHLARVQTLEPKVSITSFYLGNDLFDDALLMRTLGEGEWTEVEWQATEAPVLASGKSRERLDVGGTVVRAYTFVVDNPALLRIYTFVVENSALLSTARMHWRSLRGRDGLKEGRCAPGRDGCVSVAGRQDVLQIDWRRTMADQDKVPLRRSLDRALETIAEVDRRNKAMGIAHLVLLMPIKEAVYAWSIEGPAPPGLGALLDDVGLIRARMLRFLSERRIAYLDAEPALRAAQAEGLPYIFADGHPNALGHKAIAEALAAHPLIDEACSR